MKKRGGERRKRETRRKQRTIRPGKERNTKKKKKTDVSKKARKGRESERGKRKKKENLCLASGAHGALSLLAVGKRESVGRCFFFCLRKKKMPLRAGRCRAKRTPTRALPSRFRCILRRSPRFGEKEGRDGPRRDAQRMEVKPKKKSRARKKKTAAVKREIRRSFPPSFAKRLPRQTARSRPLLRPGYAPVQGSSRSRSLRARPRPPAAPPRRASSRGRARRAPGETPRAPSATMGRAGASASSSWARRGGPEARARPLRWRRVAPWGLSSWSRGGRREVRCLSFFFLFCFLLLAVWLIFFSRLSRPQKSSSFKHKNKIWVLFSASGGESRRQEEGGRGKRRGARVFLQQTGVGLARLLFLPERGRFAE